MFKLSTATIFTIKARQSLFNLKKRKIKTVLKRKTIPAKGLFLALKNLS